MWRRHRKRFLKQFERINVTNIVIWQTEVFHFTFALALKFDAEVFQDDHGGLKWALAENKIVSVVLQIFTWCFMIAIGREEEKIVDWYWTFWLCSWTSNWTYDVCRNKSNIRFLMLQVPSFFLTSLNLIQKLTIKWVQWKLKDHPWTASQSQTQTEDSSIGDTCTQSDSHSVTGLYLHIFLAALAAW